MSFGGGGIYFGEFNAFSATQYGLFSMSVALIFIGVIVLANRLSSLESQDKK